MFYKNVVLSGIFSFIYYFPYKLSNYAFGIKFVNASMKGKIKKTIFKILERKKLKF